MICSVLILYKKKTDNMMEQPAHALKPFQCSTQRSCFVTVSEILDNNITVRS